MILFYKRFFLVLIGLAIIADKPKANAAPTLPGSSTALRSYSAAQQEGLIGISEDIPLDNPADNIFHVDVTDALCGEETVWLVYDLEGVEDHTSVSRSINDQLAVGGYLVKKRRGWATQREQIHGAWLKKGDNVIRFTMPENAAHSYRVRNLKIEIEHTGTNGNQTQIVFNQPSMNYFFDKAYVKGVVTGTGFRDVRIAVDGNEARTFNGEFEAVVDFSEAQASCYVEVEARHYDGTTTCHRIMFSEPLTADYRYNMDHSTYRNEKYFDTKKEQSLSLNGAVLHHTADALTENAMLSITSLRAVDIPPLDAGMVNVTKNHAGFRFLPHGMNFAKEVNITIPFDPAAVPDGYTEKDIRTYYFDEQSHHWVPLALDTVLMEKGQVISKTIHFTDMINGIIKVPEAPEVEAYNSTSMKGIKAANPTAAVNLINPPQANNTGNASLGYPINVPAGRAGMQPQLTISYNSGAGNGWMGLGWNLSLPMISIDTRWGVPRYDEEKETETYTMNGEQLTPVAHRGVLRDRNTTVDTVSFHPRVEGAFNKIIRHGRTPAKYWWEVTDKTGTKYYYGGSPSGFDEGAVLRTKEDGEQSKGNVALWCLREIRDLNGNTVRYHYAKVSDAGVNGGTVMGHQIYIERITYTGYQGGDGPYVVNFIREARFDKMIGANLGFKQVTGDRLRRIEVMFGATPIRSYEVEYAEGAFSKSLMTSIKEFNSDDELFTSHAFSYYDDVNAKDGYAPFSREVSVNSIGDEINGGFLDKGAAYNDKASVLSGTQSESIGGGLAVTVGPNDQNYATKSNTAGINYSYSHSSSEGRVLMIDINGDGLSDKVMMFIDGNQKSLKYRPQIPDANDGIRFSTDLRPIHGVREFLKETSNSHDFGIESNFGIFAGVNYSLTKSKTSVYFTDANGDGLIDIVNDGRVFFNTLDDDGDPSFVTDSKYTPNPVIAGGTLDGDIVVVNPDEIQLLKDQNPLHDMVRMWRAPFDGTVSIHAPVTLLRDGSQERQAYRSADGVRVSIQLKDQDPLWSVNIAPDDYQTKEPAGLTSINVMKNDAIYFRVQSIEDGAYDQVSWAPVIAYAQHNDTIRDANNKHVYRFEAKDDFILAAEQTLAMPIDGKIRIEGAFNKPITSDSVEIEVIHVTSSGPSIIDSKEFDDQDDINIPTRLERVVAAGDKFIFRVSSSSNIRWGDIEWKPSLYYLESHDPNVTEVVDEEGNYLIRTNPVPTYSIYAETVVKSAEWFATKSDSIDVKPFLDFTQIMNVDDEEVSFTIKKRDSLIAKFVLNVRDTLVTDKFTNESPTAKRIRVRKGDKLFFEYHTRSRTVAGNLQRHEANIKFQNKDSLSVQAALHSMIDASQTIFGPMYRHWGMFSYNGNGERGELPIDETKLNVDQFSAAPAAIDLSNSASEEEMNSTFGASGGYRADKEAFVMMYAEGGKQRWMGNDDFTFIHADTMSSSRMGLDQISELFPELSQGDGSAFAIDKITKSNQTSIAVSAAAGINGSKGNSRVITDFMDMNGDRYPDILGEHRIQYTLPDGGLEGTSTPHDWEFGHRTKLLAGGVSVGGGFPKSGKEAGSAPKNSVFSSIGEATSLNVSALWSKDEAEYTWLDMNGDGLPDRVDVENGRVALNLGYAFSSAESWGSFVIREGSSENFAGGLGVNIKNKSISAGVGYSRSDNTLKATLQDMNGDGLPDKVYVGPVVSVFFNTGNGFASNSVTWGDISQVSKGAATSFSANGAFTIGFPLLPIAPVVKLCINPKVFYSRGFSRQNIQLSDVDGDGFSDYLRSDHDGELKVRRSTIGRTNLLKAVQRPLGSAFKLTYEQIGNTFEMSNSVWALDSVKVFDGYNGDGADSMLTTYTYEGGLYNRREREFYGFHKVTTRTHNTENDAFPVYTTVTQTFANDNYYEKGLLLSEVMTDGEGNKFIEKENVYELKNITSGEEVTDNEKVSDSGNAFPALVQTRQRFYEGQSDAGKSTRMEYGYDKKGNVVTYTDHGDDTPEDDLSAAISYHNLKELYVIGTPERITVTNSGAALRKRQSVIDPVTGNITQIKQFLSEDEVAFHDFEYDEYGNLTKMTRPKNGKDQRLSFEYVYDDKVHTYTTKVSNSYGYSSEATYDFSFGQVLSSKDLNGNQVTYELDKLGRVKNITGPYEQGGSNKTIEFEYHPQDEIPWALTRHYDPSDPQNKLETVIFVDGLGRVLQTKKDAAIFQGEGKADTEVMVVSGRVTFDAFGRTVSALYPITEPKDDTPGDFNPDKDGEKPTLSEYDVLNRTLKVTLPDGAVTETLYGFGGDRNGTSQFSTKTTDANGKQTEQFTDVRGRVTAVKNHTTEKEIWTSFKYNAINEQIEAMDDLGHTTLSGYDNFGRRITRVHPDAGQTNYLYDLAGNLTQLETANLIEAGMAIEYTYDFERLTDITYPQNPENNVKYTYGEPGGSDNRAGRVVLQEDASGAQEFFYGRLGEIVKNIRTIVIPQHDEQTHTTEWQYDTWSRLTSMTYADGEKVTYNYNSGGLLRSMSGKKKGSAYAYVNQLGYDKFEQRVYLEYGNGTKTTYNYEPDRRRLKNMTAHTKAKRLFMDNTYTYDKVNNILSLENKAPVPSSNLMGGASSYSYDYDDLYRLTNAEGSYKGSNEEHSYTLSMSYNSVGGITKKTQVHKKGEQEQKKTSYDLSYTYGRTQPHAPIHIEDQAYAYDANGNQTGWTSDVSGQRRVILWDEENRIRSIYDNGSQHHYIYDASGERVIKGKSMGQRIFVNGEWKAGSGQMGNYTVYVNPYLVLKSGGYTKHYYIEGQRIVSKLGGGWDNANKNAKAGGSKVDYVGKTQKVFDGIVKNLKFLGADGQILTAGKSGKIPPGQISGTGGGNVTEAFRYFYHPDHLGSTSYVTDASGEVYQHLEYFAFGETFVEEHSNTDRTPYLFNGKELDEETGLYYYGARYYDARVSAWVSVDPLAEKYPNMTPFGYCGNNPIKHVDPDGRKYLNFDENGSYTGTTNDNWFHNLFVGNRGRILDAKGNVSRTFSFADPKQDAKDIESGVITKLVVVQENDIQSMMTNSGAFDEANRTSSKPLSERYDYILNEGIGGGKMDFSYTQIPDTYPGASSDPLSAPSSMIFLVGDVAHNQMNFGNFLFGAAGYSLGYTEAELRTGAHYNSLFNSDKNGYPSQLDSSDDQWSIQLGVSHSSQQGYRDKEFVGGKVVTKKR